MINLSYKVALNLYMPFYYLSLSYLQYKNQLIRIIHFNKLTLMRHSLLKLTAFVVCLLFSIPGQSAKSRLSYADQPLAAYSEPGNEEQVQIYGSSGDSYYRIYQETEGTAYVWANLDHFNPDSLYVRFQLEETDLSVLTFALQDTDTGEEESIALDNNDGFWIPQNYFKNENGSSWYNLNLLIRSKTEITVHYSLSVYPSSEVTGNPLASFNNHAIHFILDENFPDIKTTSTRLSGDLNQKIPFEIQILKPGFLLNDSSQIHIYVNVDDYEKYNPQDITITGSGIEKTPDSDREYIVKIASIQAQTYSFQIEASNNFAGWININLEGTDGYSITNTQEVSIIIPMQYSEEDIAVLKRLAEDNPLSTDLQRFIENEYYLKDYSYEDGYNVGVVWSKEIPSRVERLNIKDYEKRIDNLNSITGLTALQEIRINGTNLSSLNLSSFTNLQRLYLWDTPLYWHDVDLPISKPENFHISGNTRISIGSGLDDYNSVAANGTEIDLSEYAVVDGTASTYQWYKEDESNGRRTEVTMPVASGETSGKFILTGTPGEYYICEIKNPLYDDWTLQSSRVKISRDSDSYSQQDIDGLKKLANDNPHITKLKEFVESKGWETDNWNSWEDYIRTNWSSGDTARLTHLLIELPWEEEPDSISSLDLSVFNELRYFECERFMNITNLDLSKNTKLEELYVYSRNLQELDLSACPNLRAFRFGTRSIGEGPEWEYPRTSLRSIRLDNCTQLEELRIEHAHITSLDLSPFKNLQRLYIENCQDLPSIQGFESAQQLYALELPNTTQFQSLLNNLPQTITELRLQETNYTLPPVDKLTRLIRLGVPRNLESLDLQDLPNLNYLDVENGLLKYSSIKNYRSNINYGGRSEIRLVSPSHPEYPDLFENGDTIDLSSEAVINGVESIFLWVNRKYGTEEKNALIPVEGKPGVFVLNSQEEGRGEYWCKIMNPQFCEITDINYYNGWQIAAQYIHVETERPVTFHEGDVRTLANIINESSSQELQAWWDSGEWQTGVNSSNAQAVWNNEEPRRLIHLYLYNMGNQLAENIDLQGLDKLEILSLAGNQVKNLMLPTNTSSLKSIMLPYNNTLESLIVSPYSALEYLDISYTGLAACDLSQNAQLKELYLNGTTLSGIESTSPAIAGQLEKYGAPESVTSIDLSLFPNLKGFISNESIKYSDVLNPRQMDPVNYNQMLYVGSVRNAYSKYGETLDYSAEMNVGGTNSSIQWRVADSEFVSGEDLGLSNATYTISDTITPNKKVIATIQNTMFPGWTMSFCTTTYTLDGDANLDKRVNIQDITATASHILQDTENMISNFGFVEADVNYDERIQIADIVGIVNLIQGKTVTKTNPLRSDYEPTVWIESDEKGFLSITSPVAIAGIQLEFTGATSELPLIGNAAKFAQACSLNKDTLRILGYSMDGTTIPAGKKTVIMQLTAGLKLESAAFADPQANSLKAEGDGLSTAIEWIQPINQVDRIDNYPNPFRGSTTFRYNLKERASAVSIQIYATSGALVSVLSGLPGEVGLNQHTASFNLPAGIYIYRMSAQSENKNMISKSNILIIK